MDTEANLAGESAEIATRSHVNRVTATVIRSCDTINIGYFPEHCSLVTLLLWSAACDERAYLKYNSNEYHNWKGCYYEKKSFGLLPWFGQIFFQCTIKTKRQQNHTTFYSSRTDTAYNRCKWPIAIKYFCTKRGGNPRTASRHWRPRQTMDIRPPPRPKNILHSRLQWTRKYCALTFSLMF